MRVPGQHSVRWMAKSLILCAGRLSVDCTIVMGMWHNCKQAFVSITLNSKYCLCDAA